jgi:hypothetical protein
LSESDHGKLKDTLHALAEMLMRGHNTEKASYRLSPSEWRVVRKRPSNTPVSGIVFVMNSGHERGCWSVGWSS